MSNHEQHVSDGSAKPRNVEDLIAQWEAEGSADKLGPSQDFNFGNALDPSSWDISDQSDDSFLRTQEVVGAGPSDFDPTPFDTPGPVQPALLADEVSGFVPDYDFLENQIAGNPPSERSLPELSNQQAGDNSFLDLLQENGTIQDNYPRCSSVPPGVEEQPGGLSEDLSEEQFQALVAEVLEKPNEQLPAPSSTPSDEEKADSLHFGCSPHLNCPKQVIDWAVFDFPDAVPDASGSELCYPPPDAELPSSGPYYTGPAQQFQMGQDQSIVEDWQAQAHVTNPSGLGVSPDLQFPHAMNTTAEAPLQNQVGQDQYYQNPGFHPNDVVAINQQAATNSVAVAFPQNQVGQAQPVPDFLSAPGAVTNVTQQAGNMTVPAGLDAPTAALRQVSSSSKSARKRKRNMEPLNPYPQRISQLAPWGGSARQADLFRYARDSPRLEPSVYTAEQLRLYFYNCPRRLKLRVQQAPAQCNGRTHPDDRKCRFLSCPDKSRTIRPGWIRVAFDEFADLTTNGCCDPFKVAGSMHLWCFEQCFDPMELHQAGLLEADDRWLAREGRNPMALTRDHGCMIREAFNPWFRQHARDYPNGRPMPWVPRAHEESLSFQLVEHHLNNQVPARQNARSRRNGKKHVQTPLRTLDVHKGDLSKYIAAGRGPSDEIDEDE